MKKHLICYNCNGDQNNYLADAGQCLFHHYSGGYGLTKAALETNIVNISLQHNTKAGVQEALVAQRSKNEHKDKFRRNGASWGRYTIGLQWQCKPHLNSCRIASRSPTFLNSETRSHTCALSIGQKTREKMVRDEECKFSKTSTYP
jgi:hypothetical protein